MNMYQLILTIYGGATLFVALVIFALCMAAHRADACIARSQRRRFHALRRQDSASSGLKPQAKAWLLPSDAV